MNHSELCHNCLLQGRFVFMSREITKMHVYARLNLKKFSGLFPRIPVKGKEEEGNGKGGKWMGGAVAAPEFFDSRGTAGASEF
jgi:hypothetical protein